MPRRVRVAAPPARAGSTPDRRRDSSGHERRIGRRRTCRRWRSPRRAVLPRRVPVSPARASTASVSDASMSSVSSGSSSRWCIRTVAANMTSGDSPTPSGRLSGQARQRHAGVGDHRHHDASLRKSDVAAFLLDCGGDRRRDLVGRHDAGEAKALVAIETGLHEVVASQIIEHVGLHEPDLHHRHSRRFRRTDLERARERRGPGLRGRVDRINPANSRPTP